MMIKTAFFHNLSWNASAKKKCKQKGSLLWTDKFEKTIYFFQETNNEH